MKGSLTGRSLAIIEAFSVSVAPGVCVSFASPSILSYIMIRTNSALFTSDDVPFEVYVAMGTLWDTSSRGAMGDARKVFHTAVALTPNDKV